ncbi:phosphatase PAP2 family protein [Hymenobacter humi]
MVARRVLRNHLGLLLGVVFGFLLPWLLFLKLAGEVWEHEGFRGDRMILEWLHGHATPGQDGVALWFALAGGPWVMPALEGLLSLGLLLSRQRRAALYFLLAVGGSGLLNLFAKVMVGRARPAFWESPAPEPSYSFPSGHAMAAAALAAAIGILLWNTRARWLAVLLGMLWALGMGWSRMYLGVHFPSDVLAGWLGSLGWVGGLHLLYSRYFVELRRMWGETRLYWYGQTADRLERKNTDSKAPA